MYTTSEQAAVACGRGRSQEPLGSPDSLSLSQKLTRKLVHIICGPGFVLTWLLFRCATAIPLVDSATKCDTPPPRSSSPEARFIAALVPLANGVRLVAIGSKWVDNPAAVKAISRSGDSTELLRGPLYYVLVMVVATVAFWRTSPVGLVVIALMCFGDGFADVAGRRWGKAHKWAFNPDKSYAGSAAMFIGGLGCAAALLAAFSAAGYVSVSWQTAAPALVAITAAATLVEALPLSDAVDDNISVPSVAMVLAALML